MGKAITSFRVCAVAVVAALAMSTPAGAERTHASAAPGSEYNVRSGTLSIEFDRQVLESLEWHITPAGGLERVSSREQFTCAVDSISRLKMRVIEGRFDQIIDAKLQTHGALLLDTPDKHVPVGYLVVELGKDGIWRVTSTLHAGQDDPAPFELSSILFDFRAEAHELHLAGEFTLTQPWADRFGKPQAAGTIVGTLVLDAQLELDSAVRDDPRSGRGKRSAWDGRVTGGIGPDLLIADLQSVRRWSPREGDITAYSIGTALCNIGDEWLNWYANTVDHPVLAQNIYRLRGGRFEQIGMGWVRHASAFPGSGALCSGSNGCILDFSARHVGVGCSDIHSSEWNGGQNALGPRSQINAATGVIEWPFSAPPLEHAIDRRMQIHDADLDPALNEDALYFIEGHFIAADDTAAGNDLNSATHRPVAVTETSPDIFEISPAGRARRGEPAILAWQTVDPAVDVEYVDVPGDGWFILGYTVTGLGDGMWHYEYALHNFNSDRSGQRFSVPVPPGVTISNVGFHDVDYHSGSPYSLVDWVAAVEGESITWASEPYDQQDPNANALRWGTLYNFRFDADTCPAPGSIELGLYRPGDPSSISVAAEVPGQAVMLVASDPPDGAIDARQPFEIDHSDAAGWQSVEMTFSACASTISKSQFAITQRGVGSTPIVERVDVIDDTTIAVVLSAPISVGAWTTITHTLSQTGTTLGYLPADVDGDGTSATRDLIALIDAVSNNDGSLPPWSIDIDRSQEADLGDIVRLIDLLTGTGEYDPYMSATLP